MLETDASWQVTSSVTGNGWIRPGFESNNWKNAYSFGELGVDPWGDIQFTPPPMPAMSPPEGYEVERIYRVRSARGRGST